MTIRAEILVPILGGDLMQLGAKFYRNDARVREAAELIDAALTADPVANLEGLFDSHVARLLPIILADPKNESADPKQPEEPE